MNCDDFHRVRKNTHMRIVIFIVPFHYFQAVQCTLSAVFIEPLNKTIQQNKFYRPFVKFEDCDSQYRPHIAHFDNFPTIDSNGNLTCGIFIKSVQKNISKMKSKKLTKTVKQLRRKCIMKASYCECCDLSYSSLRHHLNTEQHKKVD
jgi:DBF zinc finger